MIVNVENLIQHLKSYNPYDKTGAYRLWEAFIALTKNIKDVDNRIENIEIPASLDIVTNISSNYSALKQNETIIVDATSGAVTVTLPNISTIPEGTTYNIKKIDASANNVVITGNVNIDNAASVSFNVRYTSFTIISDGSLWWII